MHLITFSCVIHKKVKNQSENLPLNNDTEPIHSVQRSNKSLHDLYLSKSLQTKSLKPGHIFHLNPHITAERTR
jgi:hypothetical protein